MLLEAVTLGRSTMGDASGMAVEAISPVVQPSQGWSGVESTSTVWMVD